MDKDHDHLLINRIKAYGIKTPLKMKFGAYSIARTEQKDVVNILMISKLLLELSFFIGVTFL